MTREQCRPERVEIDGEQIPVIVHGAAQMDDTDRMHLAELVAAVKRKYAAERSAVEPPEPEP